MPRKIASAKNENPSIAKPSPNTPPNVAVNPGQRSPISKLRIVPVMTPVANSATMTRVPALRERPVERIAGAQAQTLDEEDHRREADAEADERDMDDERQRLQLARLEQVVLLDRG